MTALFGPGGNSDQFYSEGNTSSAQAPKWLADYGLDAYEYQCGRGVNISPESAAKIGVEAARHGISMSVHAPYFINFCSLEQERQSKSVNYLIESVKVCSLLGGDRVIFHVGSQQKQSRNAAFLRAVEGIGEAIRACAEINPSVALCPETMGRPTQLTDLDETIELCKTYPSLIPCIDFGHLYAINHGQLDFSYVLTSMQEILGYERIKNFHAHFSKIEYGEKGEKKHLTFGQDKFGPDFEPLASLLASRGLTPRVICESAGTQAADALSMKKAYLEATGVQP